MQKILVTGANGFVGRMVCSALAERGLAVTAGVRSMEHVAWSGDETPSEIVAVGNINGSTDWTAALAGCSGVIHLAARAHILHDTNADPLAAFRDTNVAGSVQLATCAARAGVRRFVFVSSIGVNGNQNSEPFTERDVPQPSEPYAVSKLEAEEALKAETARSGMELVIVRPPLVYGPDCPGNFLRLLKLLSTGIPLPFGAIHQQRSFVSVWNLADFLCACVEDERAANQVFLVSDRSDVALPALLRGLAAGMEKPARLLPVNAGLLGMMASVAGKRTLFDKLCGELTVDASAANDVLGWVPPVSLAEGLRRTGHWYAQRP